MLFEESLLSFENVVTVRVPTYRNEILVPGILENFDLPQVYLAGCLRMVAVINPLRGDQSRVDDDEAAAAYQPVSDAYQALGTPNHWRVITHANQQERLKWILSSLVQSSDDHHSP